MTIAHNFTDPAKPCPCGAGPHEPHRNASQGND